MKSKVEIKRAPDKTLKALQKMNKQFKNMPGVLAGLPKGSPKHEDEETGEFNSIIQIGMVHEFGTDIVPERSYLRSTIIEGKRDYKAFMAKLAKKVASGEMTSKVAMGLLGEKLQGDIKAKITDIKSPPLSVRIGGNPLVDTGQLRSSISYIIRN